MSQKNIVGIEIVIEDCDSKERILRRTWFCINDSKPKGNFFKIEQKEVKTRLPNSLRFKPDLLDSNYKPFARLKIKAWLLTMIEYNHLKSTLSFNKAFQKATTRHELSTSLNAPYSRTSRLTQRSVNFFTQIEYNNELLKLYQCPYEEGELKFKTLRLLFIKHNFDY